ncbi:MAG: hypothetical protein JWR16_1838 [Nevskia sp.]|nr:hypothetical protein [Nevskia sp.]
MKRRLLTRGQLAVEIEKMIKQSTRPGSICSEVRVGSIVAIAPDKDGCNWMLEGYIGHSSCAADVEEAAQIVRQDFNLAAA